MSLTTLSKEIISCNRCTRLRTHCMEIARVKRKQFLDETYWGKPVPGFGDPKARILVVGLAPAAHGANRTGRMFTGDQSGVWLYRALYRAGFSNQESSLHQEDGLRLRDAYITAIARCAPPENKPTLDEMKTCSLFLKAEIAALSQIQVFLALGQIALRGLYRVLPDELKSTKGLPKFIHGGEIRLKDGRVILCSYHPSQQNTFTKKLTEPMFDKIFERAKNFLQSD